MRITPESSGLASSTITNRAPAMLARNEFSKSSVCPVAGKKDDAGKESCYDCMTRYLCCVPKLIWSAITTIVYYATCCMLCKGEAGSEEVKSKVLADITSAKTPEAAKTVVAEAIKSNPKLQKELVSDHVDFRAWVRLPEATAESVKTWSKRDSQTEELTKLIQKDPQTFAKSYSLAKTEAGKVQNKS